MDNTRLEKIISDHELWLHGRGGSRANLRGVNLSGVNLGGANLRDADLRDADLSGVNLGGANLRDADLRGVNLSGVNLGGANLRDADLSGVNLRGVNLRDADLSGVNLRGANLSGAKNLLSAIHYIDAHFERTTDGYIAYKTFNGQYRAPDAWKIEPGAIIEETPNPDRGTDCGSGINVAPLAWVHERYGNKSIWKLLIRWEWLPGVVVPFATDGKIRCERAELIGIVEGCE